MAVLNKIRQRSLILILVIALALFSFVIGDLFKNTDALTGGSQDVIATVNGEDIMRDAFMFRVENMQRRFGPNSTSTQVMNNVYNQELRRIILNTEYDALGLTVERDQMRDLLKTSFSSYPEFQNEDSIFDVGRLNAFIANLKDIQPERAPLGTFQISYGEWTNNEQSIANNAIQQSYYNMIKAGVNATLGEAEDEHNAENKTVDIKYVQIPYNTIADSLITVTKSDIKAYMEKHKEEYTVDENREVIYTVFKEEASKADEEIIKDALLAAKADRIDSEEVNGTVITDSITGFDNVTDYAEFINANSDIKFSDVILRGVQLPATSKDSILNTALNSYYGPYKEDGYYKLTKVIEKKQLADSAKVRHILIPYAGATRVDPSETRTSAEAKVEADSILEVLKGNRSKFVSLLELSSDKVSNEKEGVLEFGYNSSFAPEFKQFSFENEIGDIDVVETSFGFHIIEILDQSSFNDAVKLATLAREIEPSEETIDQVFNDVSKFEIAIQDGDFKTIAEEREQDVRPITFKALDENIPGLGSQRQIVRWAFENDAKEGNTKRFTIAGTGYVVAKLVKINKEGLMNVDNATTPVLAEIRKERKAEMIRAKITGTTVDDIAKNQGQSMRTATAITLNNTTLSGAGVEPMVIGTAFGLAEGKTSKPVDGNKGVYVLEVTKITEATPLDNYAAIMNRLSDTRKSSVQTKVYTALEEAADIEDNRAKTVY